MAPVLGKDYIPLLIDSRMKNGPNVAKRLRDGHEGGGIPWMVILDEGGERLVTSDGPKGNVGCPVTEEEVSWFKEMLLKTSRHMTPEDMKQVLDALEGFAAKYRRPS